MAEAAATERMATYRHSELISRLEKKKDFEVYKEDIAEIRFKRPGILRGGHLRIRTTDGREVKVVICDKKVYETLINVLRKFKPEAVDLK